jgi:hypothetical protein
MALPPSLTRIRNNQVYNSDIYADAKVVTKSISGGLLSDNFTYTGNMTIGNLTISGNTTTIDTTNLVIADPMFSINRNATGVPAYDLGMIMGRGSSTNVAFIWEENAQQFQLQYTTQSTASTTFGIINNSGFANLQVYGLAASNATIGSASLTTLNTSSTITSSGNIWAASGTASTNTTTGALVVTGGAGVSGALVVGTGISMQGNGTIVTDQTTATVFNTVSTTVNAFQAATALSMGATSGSLTLRNPTIVSSSTAVTLFNTVATTMNFAGAATALKMGATSGTANIANPFLIGSQTTQSLYDNVATTMNFAGAATNINIGATSGLVTIKNATLNLPNTTQVLMNGANPTIDTSSTGTASVFNANTTTVNIGGAATTVSIGADTGTTTVNNDLKADNFTSTGGGQHIGYITGAIGANTPNTGVFTTATVNGTLNAATLNAGSIGNSGATFGGASMTLTGNVSVNAVSAGQIGNTTTILEGTIGSATPSQPNITSLGTLSSLTVSGAVNANTFNGVAVYAGTIGNTGAAITASTATLTGTANSYGSGQGALQITGGFYAGGDSYIAGNLTVANLTSLGSTSLVANAPLLYLAVSGFTNYNYEIGFYSHKYDAAVGYNHTGIVRNHIDNAWYVFSNLRSEPSTTVDLANAYLIYDTVKLGNIIAYSGNTSTSTTTGAAVIYGGMGVGGNIYAAAIQNTPIGNGTASTGAFTTLTTSSTITSQGTVAAPTLNAGTIGNAGATISGASMTLTGNISVNAVSAGQIGNTNTILEGTIASVSSSQPNITSIGTLNSLTVTGNASVGNLNSAGQVIGYLNGAIGANVPNSAVFTSLLTTTSGGNGNAYIAGNLIVTGNINAITANVYTQGGIFYGLPVTGMNALYAGQTGYTPLANVVAQFSGNTNNYTQINLENSNTGAQASGDIVVTADNGTDVDTFIDMGINGSGYSQAAFSLTKANDGYLYVAGNTTTGGGNLVISTTTANDIIYSLGGVANANEFARMRANTNSFVISSTTASTTTNTGALQVRGGAGISGDLNVGGNINGTTSKNVPTIYTSNIYPYANAGNINLYPQLNTNVTVNANQIVANLVVHGNSAAGYQNLLTTNGATGQVGIKVAPSQIVGNTSLQINGTDSMIIPTGAQANRPSNAQQGMIRFNTNSSQLEFYTGTTWSGTGTAFTIITADQFVGDGSQTNFTLSQSTTTAGTLVSINGVIQLPTTAYSVSGTTLTFTEAPLSTDIIDARALTTTGTVTSITDATGGNTVVANTGGVYTTAVNSVAHLANSSGNFFGGGISTLSANTSLSAGVPTIIDSFSTSTYRGAKYVVTLSDYTNNNFTLAEVVLVCGSSNASVQTYGVVSANGTSIGNFYANVSGTTARLYANAGVSSYAKVQQIYMPL